MKQLLCAAVLLAAAMSASAVSLPLITKCPPDAVLVGPTCVDKFEASVWQIPASNTILINMVKKGTATLAALTSGATLISPAAGALPCGAPSFPPTFPPDGNWTAPLYSASIAGVLPTACITWFQAEQACALSGKRLIRNDEWQRAAAGTPDPGGSAGAMDCNTTAGAPVNTGSRANCKSSWGAFDMVGNVDELVADWLPAPTACPGWGRFSDDFMCLAGASTTIGPTALIRGGNFSHGTGAGVFAVNGSWPPTPDNFGAGFRCAR